MQRLPQATIMGSVFDTLRQHAIAVNKGEDSQAAANRLFTGPKTAGNSICCDAPVITEGLHTWCEACGEYSLIAEDRKLAF